MRPRNEIATETQNNTNILSGIDLGNAAKQMVKTVADTVNNNKLLIGGLAAGCGVTIFLLATNAGRRVRSEISNRAEDLYDFMSDQAGNAWEQMQDLVQSTINRQEESVSEASEKIRRTA